MQPPARAQNGRRLSSSTSCRRLMLRVGRSLLHQNGRTVGESASQIGPGDRCAFQNAERRFCSRGGTSCTCRGLDPAPHTSRTCPYKRHFMPLRAIIREGRTSAGWWASRAQGAALRRRRFTAFPYFYVRSTRAIAIIAVIATTRQLLDT